MTQDPGPRTQAHRVLTRSEACELVKAGRSNRRVIVFTNGVFDILHPGHIRYLRDARALGDLLIVGVNSDRSVKALNKAPDRPINSEDERAEVLSALASVDAVVVFDEDTPHEIISAIQPDILVCRSERPLPDSEKRKIALFTNVQNRAVISAVDVDDIYKIPALLHQQNLDELVVEHFGIECRKADLSQWDRVVAARDAQDTEIEIAMVGKYVDLTDAYKSLNEALNHAGRHTATKVKIRYIEAESVEGQGARVLQGADAILVPGGFGNRGIEGKIEAVRYARENKIPYLGICLGLQVAVIEYARNVCGLKDANSTEMVPKTPHPVIALVTEWHDASGTVQQRSNRSNLGGTMRLGVQAARLKAGTRCRAMYNSEVISERHRHRFEVNNNYRKDLEGKGLIIAGETTDENLVEMVELADHPFFVASQFHPEFTSGPRDGHPLFNGFIKAAREHHLANQAAAA